MAKKVFLSEIIKFLGESVSAIHGFKDDFYLCGIASLERSYKDLIDWVHPNCIDAQKTAEASMSRLIITSQNVSYTRALQDAEKVLIQVENPYYTIAIVGNEFFVEKPHPGVHESAVLSDSASIGQNASIGANAVIDGCTIGDNCVIAENVIIRKCVTIGDHVTVKAGAILGEAGFNFIDNKKGGLMRFPQLGRVIIGDWVDIGSHTCVDRGAFSDTIIGDNAKINNLCHIAHNVQIGEKTIIAAHVNVSGSTQIGSNVWIGPNATFRGHQTVGDHAFIGSGANVVSDIPSNEVWVGNPARFLRKNEK
jgi:UDP-3-O-[3-hydroxymyristoyl] glucosamine N-acyltransferase